MNTRSHLSGPRPETGGQGRPTLADTDDLALVAIRDALTLDLR